MANMKALLLRQSEEVEALLFGNPAYRIECEDSNGMNIISPSKFETRNLQSTLHSCGYSFNSQKLRDGTFRIRVDYRGYQH